MFRYGTAGERKGSRIKPNEFVVFFRRQHPPASAYLASKVSRQFDRHLTWRPWLSRLCYRADLLLHPVSDPRGVKHVIGGHTGLSRQYVVEILAGQRFGSPSCVRAAFGQEGGRRRFEGAPGNTVLQ